MTWAMLQMISLSLGNLFPVFLGKITGYTQSLISDSLKMSDSCESFQRGTKRALHWCLTLICFTLTVLFGRTANMFYGTWRDGLWVWICISSYFILDNCNNLKSNNQECVIHKVGVSDVFGKSLGETTQQETSDAYWGERMMAAPHICWWRKWSCYNRAVVLFLSSLALKETQGTFPGAHLLWKYSRIAWQWLLDKKKTPWRSYFPAIFSTVILPLSFPPFIVMEEIGERRMEKTLVSVMIEPWLW